MRFREEINAIFKRTGIQLWGGCDFAPLRDHLISCRAKARLPQDAASVLCAAVPYRVEEPERNLSHYAVPRDYHKVLLPLLEEISSALRELFPGYAFEAFADNSPIAEVHAAALCGLGVVGEHGLLITPDYGSWVFLGEIVTDLMLEAGCSPIASCLFCGACLSACPGSALAKEGFRKESCLSHLTQKKGELTQEERSLIRRGSLIWGCDRCQEVCPMNRGVKVCDFPPFLEERIPILKEGEAGQLADRAFQWRPEEVIERNRAILAEQAKETERE